MFFSVTPNGQRCSAFRPIQTSWLAASPWEKDDLDLIGVRLPVRGDVALMIASAEHAAVATDAALPIAAAIVAA